jgi:hypothetical protein
MRKFLKNNILEIFNTIYEAHKIIRNFIKTNEYENAGTLLGDCCDSAARIGIIIENSEGKGFVTVGILAEYCKYAQQISMSVSDKCSGSEIKKTLDKLLNKAEKSVKNDIKVKLEIVFAPYKASMWDSLESVWKAADEDPDCNAYVVPIPYYDRNSDHSFGEFHYEGNQFPEYVSVVHYDAYNFEARRPDKIYIHNPYDNCNYVTSVAPRFYSSELKKHTDELVYIPYFVIDEPDPENEETLKRNLNFIIVPGVINADKVIVQSEAMKQVYMKVLLRHMGDTPENRKLLENKISGKGSPKFEKLKNTSIDDIKIPESWKKIIYKQNGERKKVIFYNTSIASLLEHDYKMIEKICNVLNVFLKNKDEVVLLWRPHPLMRATIQSMRPHLQENYESILNQYIAGGWGIYDDTSDLERAILISDAYYGDSSSVVQLYRTTNKPVMIQNVDVMEEKYIID